MGLFTMPQTVNEIVTFPYDPNLDPGHYAKVSIALWRNPNYSLNAKGVYTYLLTYATQYKDVFPGYELMCKELGISEKTLRNAINELVGAELLVVKRRGQGKTNKYLVYFIPLINNYGDKGLPHNQISRSGTDPVTSYIESESKKHGNRTYRRLNQKKKGPIDFTKYQPGGLYEVDVIS